MVTGLRVVQFIMVIELSGVQFGLKSYAWFQNRTSAQRELDLKSQVWFQAKIAWPEVQLPLWIGRHEVLLSINHKNYNFREKEKIAKLWKKGKIRIKNSDKGGVNISKVKGKNTKATACAQARVITTLNVIGWFKLHLWMWLAY